MIKTLIGLLRLHITWLILIMHTQGNSMRHGILIAAVNRHEL